MKKQCETEPWERQPDDTPAEYKAFVVYRELGHEPEGEPKQKRSLKKTAEIVGKNVSMIKKWSTEFDWQERAREYDNELQRIKLVAKKDEIIQMQKRHMKVARELLKKAYDRLLDMPVEELSNRDVQEYIKLGAALEKASRVDNYSVEGGITASNSSGGVMPSILTAEEEETSGMMQLVQSLNEARKGRS